MHLTVSISRDRGPGLLMTSGFQWEGEVASHSVSLNSHLASAVYCELVFFEREKNWGREKTPFKCALAWMPLSVPCPVLLNSKGGLSLIVMGIVETDPRVLSLMLVLCTSVVPLVQRDQCFTDCNCSSQNP